MRPGFESPWGRHLNPSYSGVVRDQGQVVAVQGCRRDQGSDDRLHTNGHIYGAFKVGEVAVTGYRDSVARFKLSEPN
jgi:hypothetical protein